jgi:hypothetical protein
MRLLKIFNLIVYLFFTNVFFAQSTTAKIENVKQEGLHKMVIPVDLRSISKNDLSDFRILDSKGNEVPYFVDRNLEITSNSSFAAYKIVSKTEIPKKQSIFIFENPEKKINQVVLNIANYDGEKTYALSGSNNLLEWFGIANNNYLTDLSTLNATYVSKTISFPLNNYKYIKIDLDDKKSLPIRIISVGNFDFKTITTPFLPVNYSKKTVTELKSDKKTLLYFEFENPTDIEEIKFLISGPKLYKRYVKIYKNSTRKVKHKLETYQEFITNFELNSTANNTLTLAGIREKSFYIEIDNQDNPPLFIDDVQFFQRPISIIADLKVNQSYSIKTGNPNLAAPIYDIESFKNNISTNLPTTIIYDVKMTKKTVSNTTSKSFWQQPWFMWTCICVTAIGILYFASSLVKDLSKNK